MTDLYRVQTAGGESVVVRNATHHVEYFQEFDGSRQWKLDGTWPGYLPKNCLNLDTLTRLHLLTDEDLRKRDEAAVKSAFQKFDNADWFWRTMDPDDCADSPDEAVNRSMIGNFCVCEIASSFSGPKRYGFTAPVLDTESDDEEFLHFATQQEAIDAAKERSAAIRAMKGQTNDR